MTFLQRDLHHSCYIHCRSQPMGNKMNIFYSIAICMIMLYYMILLTFRLKFFSKTYVWFTLNLMFFWNVDIVDSLYDLIRVLPNKEIVKSRLSNHSMNSVQVFTFATQVSLCKTTPWNLAPLARRMEHIWIAKKNIQYVFLTETMQLQFRIYSQLTVWRHRQNHACTVIGWHVVSSSWF